jgi:hypothetical protein
MLIAKDLFDREDSKDKNRRLCFQGYQADIGCLTGGSSRTIVFYLVCLTEKSKHVEELIHQYFEGLVKDIQTVDSVISDN